MQLEFHQLERRLEHLRAHRPERQQRLLASLAASGQQTPVIVIATDQPERYLLIDGYRRVRALEQLGRDTVEAVVWSLSEAEALFLDRSMRAGEQATALEEGWLLAEMSERFGYDQEELARRFDRSVSWVSRRMGLVELLPAAVQQQVRSGAITAHVAMKFLVPVARMNTEDCRRMAEGFARHRLRSREAGQFYAAWRGATPTVRERLLAEPQLFLKTQRQREKSPAAPAMVELSRDLEVVIAMMRRANRRLRGATVELDLPQCAQTQAQIRLALEELNRLAIKLPQPSAAEELRANREREIPEKVRNSFHQGVEDAESESTRGDPGDARAKAEQPHDRADVEGEPLVGARGVAAGLDGGSCAGTRGDLRALPAANPGAFAALQEQSCSRAGGVGGEWSDAVVLGVDRLLPPPWDRASAGGCSGTVSASSGSRASARYFSTQGGSGGQVMQSANGIGGSMLLAHAVLPDLSHLHAFRLQGLPDRSAAIFRRLPAARGDRQHARCSPARHWSRDGAGAGDGGFCRTIWLPVRGA
jgi:ParB family chromosome partitioning protein